jgi:hypothetical protein
MHVARKLCGDVWHSLGNFQAPLAMITTSSAPAFAMQAKRTVLTSDAMMLIAETGNPYLSWNSTVPQVQAYVCKDTKDERRLRHLCVVLMPEGVIICGSSKKG